MGCRIRWRCLSRLSRTSSFPPQQQQHELRSPDVVAADHSIIMGKGYNNFMCKKPFHPASRDNMKRVWCAEQKTQSEKQKEDEMRAQYAKEQDLYNNRLLVSTESREKLSLSFMYEAPAGATKEKVREDDEPEYKFEWQRNAPRESFAKNNQEIRDQPFGIQVKNVRCLKCHVWGHLNTDSECPLNQQSSTTAILTAGAAAASATNAPGLTIDRSQLVNAMREDGLTLKKSLIGQTFVEQQANQMLAVGPDSSEMSFINSLSKKDKKKLLKKLAKLTGAPGYSSSKNKHKKDKKKKRDKEKDKKKQGKEEMRDKHDTGSSDSSTSDDHAARSGKPDARKDKRDAKDHRRDDHQDRHERRDRSCSRDRERYHRNRSTSPKQRDGKHGSSSRHRRERSRSRDQRR